MYRAALPGGMGQLAVEQMRRYTAGMSDSSLLTEMDGDACVVRFRDPSILDALAIQRIGKELSELVDGSEASRIVLSFTGIRFLSSEALRMLIGLRAKVDKSKRKVALCAIRPDLLRVFQLTNLDKLFSIYADEEQAKAKL